MEPLLYERPREKLRYKGAESLSKTELFQVLIGSGAPHFHVAKIAREVVILLDTGHKKVTYDDLASISGLGHAKVCQILAVLELTRRTLVLNSDEVKKGGVDMKVEILKKSRQPLFIYETYDGSGLLIKRRRLPRVLKQYHSVIRRISAELISDGAASFSCALGYIKQPRILNEDEWVFIKTLTDSLALLQISLKSLLLVNETSIYDIKNDIL